MSTPTNQYSLMSLLEALLNASFEAKTGTDSYISLRNEAGEMVYYDGHVDILVRAGIAIRHSSEKDLVRLRDFRIDDEDESFKR